MSLIRTFPTLRRAVPFSLLALLTGCSPAGGPSASSSPASSAPGAPASSAPVKLVIAWAKWTPADQLQKLGGEYEKATGTHIDVQQIPWDDYENKIKLAWSGRDPTYDLIVGDSQWLGKGATAGHYVELTDWAKKNVPLQDMAPLAVSEYGEYPAGSGKLWGLPCMSDATVFAYRKDLFADQSNKAAFRAKYRRDLTVPDTWADFQQVAEFFTQPDKGQYGAALFYSKSYDGVTMGWDQVLWSYGGELSDKTGKKVEGVLNSPAGVKALEYYVGLKKFTPPGSENYYFSECLRDFQQGKVAMAQSWFAFLPDLTSKEKNPKYLNQTGYFVIPKGPAGRFVSLGGQGISISAYSRQQDESRKFLAWFEKPETQKRWVELGGLTANKSVAASDTFKHATAYNTVFTQSVPYLKDFYNTPNYSELLTESQKDLNAAVAGLMPPKQALDTLAAAEQKIMDASGT